MDGEPATIERDGAIRGGHKGSHMTAPMQRIEVITRSERRRRWSIEEKREIVAESLGSGVRPSEIIQRHGITSGQLYAWRQQLTRRVDGQPVRPVAKFARVDVVAAEQASQAEPPASPSSKPQTHVPAIAAPRAKGLIEILLPGGTSVRVDGR
jgi:transposase